jgi:hypothetical protein
MSFLKPCSEAAGEEATASRKSFFSCLSVTLLGRFLTDRRVFDTKKLGFLETLRNRRGEQVQ